MILYYYVLVRITNTIILVRCAPSTTNMQNSKYYKSDTIQKGNKWKHQNKSFRLIGKSTVLSPMVMTSV